MLKALGLRAGITIKKKLNKMAASRDYFKACYSSDPQKVRAATHEKYNINPEPKMEASHGQYSTHSETIKAAAREQYSKHPETKKEAT